MEAMLALAFNLSGWRGPVAFAAVGIFVVAFVARIISMIAARRRRRAWLAEGYTSREEVRRAIREENIGDWLEKMRSTPAEFKVLKKTPKAVEKEGDHLFKSIDGVIKEFSKSLEKVVDLKKDPPVPSLEEHGPSVIYPVGYKPACLFSWYRAPAGNLLHRIIEKDFKVSDNCGHFLNQVGQKHVLFFGSLRVAYPKTGEWWMKMECSSHKVDREVRLQVRDEYSWYQSPERIEELYCGCLMPINFGNGFPTVVGTEFLKTGPGGAGSDGGSGQEGLNGGAGGVAIAPPEDMCGLCRGASEIVDTDMYKAVPCPRCEGTGREP